MTTEVNFSDMEDQNYISYITSRSNIKWFILGEKKMLKNAFRSVASLISSKDKIYEPHKMGFGISFPTRGQQFLCYN